MAIDITPGTLLGYCSNGLSVLLKPQVFESKYFVKANKEETSTRQKTIKAHTIVKIALEIQQIDS